MDVTSRAGRQENGLRERAREWRKRAEGQGPIERERAEQKKMRPRFRMKDRL